MAEIDKVKQTLIASGCKVTDENNSSMSFQCPSGEAIFVAKNMPRSRETPRDEDEQ